jgi:hypothetical protein
MKSKEVEQKVFKVIREYKNVLDNTAKRSFGIPESLLPYRKKIIKNAIKLALVMAKDEAQREQLKISYISLANFIPAFFLFLRWMKRERKNF